MNLGGNLDVNLGGKTHNFATLSTEYIIMIMIIITQSRLLPPFVFH